jgi:hypothetical protein
VFRIGAADGLWLIVHTINSKRKAEEMLAAYPQNPAEATLLQQAHGGVGMIITGAILVIIPVMIRCAFLIATVMGQ